MNISDMHAHVDHAAAMLDPWALAAETFWVDHPAEPRVGWYGTGYNSWGVQTNQKYIAAAATVGVHTKSEKYIDRALAAMRFMLRSHVGAQGQADALTCSDGTRWGHTWISPLGIERMMFAVRLLEGHLTQQDHAMLRRMLVSEATWQHDEHRRGQNVGICTDVWGHSGKNNPESNIWVGSLMWRVAQMYPDEPGAAKWRDKAESYLLNGVSVAADSGHARFVGPNFFPNFALDHHGYFNVGYMVICVSNAALLHFDLKHQGHGRPECLDHHQRELWRAVRTMLFDDGRLARLGGDSRLRYTYCQEYLLPSLLYAAEHLGDGEALGLVPPVLEMIQTEQRYSGDGSFYGRRLRKMYQRNPYYATRLESDRACVLAHLMTHLPDVVAKVQERKGQAVQAAAEAAAGGATERVVVRDAAADGGTAGAGSEGWRLTQWQEPEYGAMLHRSATRLASFAWRAHGYTQGMCLPPGRGDLAEWSCNLAGTVLFVGQPGAVVGGHSPHRRLLAHRQWAFEGGFVTLGSMMEGVDLIVPEGQRMTDQAEHHLCFAALPDGHTAVGMQIIRVRDKLACVSKVQGMRLNVPNDVYNSHVRTWHTAAAGGEGAPVKRIVQSPAMKGELLDLQSDWACVDDTLGVVGLYGSESLTLDRAAARRGGFYESLHVDELCWHVTDQTTMRMPGEVILDVGWRVMASVDHVKTAALAAEDRKANAAVGRGGETLQRQVVVRGCDGKLYRVMADFGDMHASVEAV